jgi:hypothetical protein
LSPDVRLLDYRERQLQGNGGTLVVHRRSGFDGEGDPLRVGRQGLQVDVNLAVA